jgi:hypothetical protein
MKALIAFLFACAIFPAHAFSWQDSAEYRPPAFEANFPHDPAAAKRLAEIIPALERGQPPANSFELIQHGLRALPIDRQMPALRGFGNSYIWNKSPQNPQAIELMYHAAGSTNSQISYNAIYFGLSTVRPMTQSILRTLADVAMNSEDPNTLSRIAWGASSYKTDIINYLEPYLESTDLKRRDHAEDLRKIFSGELKAFAWADARARIAAQDKFGHRLEEFRQTLLTGDTKARREIFDLIERNRINLIMDETFIPAFAAAASDANDGVRKSATTITGLTWIWNTTNQSPAAIDLMLRLSRDNAREVRYSSLYFGLSTVRNPSDAIIERMLEMLFLDGIDHSDVRRRITWGLRDQKPAVARVLDKWIQGADPVRALLAYGFYLNFIGAQPDLPTSMTALIEKLDLPVAGVIALALVNPESESLDDYFGRLRQVVPAPYNDRILWTNNQGPPFIILEQSEATAFKQVVANDSRLKIPFEKTLPVKALIHIGKEGGLKTFRE